MLYYPPYMELYWFIGRTSFLLNSYTGILPFRVLDDVKNLLVYTLRTSGTTQLLAAANYSDNFVFWDDFLGDNDTDFFGQHVNNADDRLFSTAVAVNALIDIWTEYNATCPRIWVSDTPAIVISAVNDALSWINNNILTGSYLPMNSFFSGSMKSLVQFPDIYPGNFYQDLNGTILNPFNESINVIGDITAIGVSGVIEKNTYQELLTEKFFNYSVPTQFEGYNNSPFPFWSASALTYAASMLAFSKAQLLNTCA